MRLRLVYNGMLFISPYYFGYVFCFRCLFSVLIRYSVGAFRVTMAAVNTRSSVCLSQFVLGGKSYAFSTLFSLSFRPVTRAFHRTPRIRLHLVLSFPIFADPMLRLNETFTSLGRCVVLAHNLYRGSASPEGPQTSADVFLLLCHGSVMYLHVLSTPAPLSHPPILPTLPARQLETPETDFRVTDFVKNFLLPARLAPASANSAYTITPKIRGVWLFLPCEHHVQLALL